MNRVLALSIIDRMGQTGQPPARGALEVNVGTQPLLDLLREEYLVPIRELSRVSAFKLVQAPFGGGKTHFLHCLREVAWAERFVTALVSVSAQELPCDDPVLVYQGVAQRLEAPPADPLEEGEIGVDALLRREVEQRLDASPASEVLAWLADDFSHARVDSHAVRRGAELLMQGVIEHNAELVRLMAAFLRGEDVDAGELRPHGIREALGPSTGFRFLRSLAQIGRALGLPGIVLLFDEMDRVMALPLKRRKAVGDTVRQVIDQCGQATLPGLLWVYAVPPEFMTNVVPEYPALEQRLKGVTRFGKLSPQSPLIDLDHLSMATPALLDGIGQRLLSVYEAAYGVTLDREAALHNVGSLAREMAERQLESGGRRDFVKRVVELLTTQHRGGQHKLGTDDVRRLAAGAAPPVAASLHDDEEIFGA